MKTQRAHDALYDPNATYFDYSNMLPYFKADGQRISNANQAVRNINSHRNYHFYDLMNAYEDLSNIEDAMQYSDDLTLDEEYESLQQLINDIISEARIGRK